MKTSRAMSSSQHQNISYPYSHSSSGMTRKFMPHTPVRNWSGTKSAVTSVSTYSTRECRSSTACRKYCCSDATLVCSERISELTAASSPLSDCHKCAGVAAGWPAPSSSACTSGAVARTTFSSTVRRSCRCCAWSLIGRVVIASSSSSTHSLRTTCA
uniref:Uncharacterized protein n=1 Tax=Emiliania huxleyi TaxID=2903 RepID=A0A6T0DGC5_EMIHU